VPITVVIDALVAITVHFTVTGKILMPEITNGSWT